MSGQVGDSGTRDHPNEYISTSSSRKTFSLEPDTEKGGGKRSCKPSAANIDDGVEIEPDRNTCLGLEDYSEWDCNAQISTAETNAKSSDTKLLCSNKRDTEQIASPDDAIRLSKSSSSKPKPPQEIRTVTIFPADTSHWKFKAERRPTCVKEANES